MLERLRSWSYRRQLLGRAAPDILSALRGVIAVYSTHPTAPLSLLARSAAFEASDLSALEHDKRALRVLAMRGSSFLVPTESAARIFSATRAPHTRLQRRLQVDGVDLDTYRRLTPGVLAAARTPLRPREVRHALGEDAAVLVSRILSWEGRILRIGGHLRVDQLRYVATQAWLGHELEAVEPRAAWSWLAHEYLRACGPARLADFAWWAGASRQVATTALSDARATDLGDGLLALSADVEAFQQVRPLQGEPLDVLPKWDAYTMAYAPDGRQRLVDDAHLGLAYTTRDNSPGAMAGDGRPLILRAGRAVATWSHRFDKNQMAVSVEPFSGERRLDRASLEAAFEQVGHLLHAAVTIRLTS
jgi:hypothetical protein